MAETKDFGQWFLQPLALDKTAPLISRASTVEIDPPFRVADSRVLHFWPGKGIAIGRWKDSDFSSEEEALFAATHVGGHDGRLGAGWAVVTDDSGEHLIPRARA